MRRILFAVMLLVAFVVMPIVALASPPQPAEDAQLVFTSPPAADLSAVGPAKAEAAREVRALFPILAALGVAGLLATLSLRVSAVSSSKLFAKMKITQCLSGDKTTAAICEWIDMKGYGSFAAVINLAVLGGNGVEAFSIVADSASDGSDGNITIKTHATPTHADAAGDMLVLECTADEIAQLGAENSDDLRYVAVKLETHHASDQVVVTQILADPVFQKADLTADDHA